MTKDFFVITRPFLLAYLLKKKNGYLNNALFTYENALPATCWKASVYLHRNRLRFDIFHSRVPQKILVCGSFLRLPAAW